MNKVARPKEIYYNEILKTSFSSKFLIRFIHFFGFNPKQKSACLFLFGSGNQFSVVNLIMPVISLFYGLIISMYYLDTKQHNLPHIHVKYAEQEAIYRIPDGQLLEGIIPKNKEKLVTAWIEIHKEDLMANWQLAVTGNKIFTIEPLK